jgi:cobalt-zinc-cadmium efflux system membrane fusion protein
MHNRIFSLLVAAAMLALTGCGAGSAPEAASGAHGEMAEPEAPKGPHKGRLLSDGDFSVELALYEVDVPPEFRAWTTRAGSPVPPSEVNLTVELTRFGNVVETVRFAPADDYLRGDTVIYEPHSFAVKVTAVHNGERHEWQFESFEGRTLIAADIAAAMGVETAVAGPATLRDVITVYGRIEPNREQQRAVTARFDGTIRSVSVSATDLVSKGDALASVESNESLNPYTVRAPIDGIVALRNANPGEQTDGRVLFEIVDTSTVWAELAVFPSQRARVAIGMPVDIVTLGGERYSGTISRINRIAQPNQSVLAHAVLDNPDGLLVPGISVTGEIELARHDVPLAVKRSALQSFRDFTVVYAQIGEEYEVKLLDTGREDDNFVEVLGGLEAGTRYVSGNSYLIKADIEKSGASHDH